MSIRRGITALTSRAALRSSLRVRRPHTAIPAPNTAASLSLSLSVSLSLSLSLSPSLCRARALNISAAPNMSSSSSSSSSTPQTPGEPKLPPLSAYEFKEYNRLAERMDAFHSHFRSSWNVLYTSASSGRRAQGMSIRAFINLGLEFVSHLELHHSIEERYVFPELARRMPEFRTGRERNLQSAHGQGQGKGQDQDEDKDQDDGKTKEAAELLRQHADIHKGMDGLQDYLNRCLSGETELQMAALKAQLDTWGAVLWTHLDQEVRTLGAENMRRYWSLDEVRKLRM